MMFVSLHHVSLWSILLYQIVNIVAVVWHNQPRAAVAAAFRHKLSSPTRRRFSCLAQFPHSLCWTCDITQVTALWSLQDGYFTLTDLFSDVIFSSLDIKISKSTFNFMSLMFGPTSVQFLRSNPFVISMKTSEIVGCCRKTLLTRRMLRPTLLCQCRQLMQLRHVTHYPMSLRLLNCTKLSKWLSLLF